MARKNNRRRNGRGKKNSTGRVYVAVIMLFMVVVMSFQIFTLYKKNAEYKETEESLEKQVKKAENKKQELEEYEQYVGSDDYTKDQASQKLGLTYDNWIILEKNKISDYIKRNNMLNKGDGVVLGLSGGPDSECLFFVFLALKEQYDLKLRCVHVNHMIRGSEADEDEQFVLDLCRRNGIDCESIKVDIPMLANKSGRSVEEEARMARYEAFERIAEQMEAKGNMAVKIAVAHNADDNAETVLFHMARGAGIDGMCGITPMRGRIIRPLLKVRKADILAFLEQNGISYCVDGTNADTDYTRNRIRHNIIPELSKVNDRAVEHIFEMTERLKEVQEYVNLQASGLLCMAQQEDGSIRKRTIMTAPAVLQQQAIKSYLSKYMPDEKDVSQVHIDAVLGLLDADGEKTIDLPHQKKLIISYDTLFVLDQCDDDTADQSIEGRFEFREFSNSKGLTYPRNTYTKWFDCDKISGNMEIRTRKEGDYLTINSSGNTKSLKDYFVDEKIPKHMRDKTLLLCDGNHVMWVVGHRISEYYKVSDDTTRIVEVKYMEEEA